VRRHLAPIAAALIAAAATAGLALADQGRGDRGGDRRGWARPYAIGLWGDVPYNDAQKTTGVPNLIADMNAKRLAFTVHDGDIKSGGSACTDDVYATAKGYFNSLSAPAFYTPGDNEWTDCDRTAGVSSGERLEHLRSTLFDTPYSFGQRRLRADLQAPPTRPYTENRRWRVRGVVYATLNVPGSNNNLGDVAPDPAEFTARDAADRAWLRQTFDDAVATKAVAVMLIIQANPGFDLDDPNRAPQRDPATLASGTQPPSPTSGSGYDELLTELRERTVAFGKPVALVHGDSHYTRVDKPLLDAAGRRIWNFTRVETPGDNAQTGTTDVQWVKVLVDPRSDEVFSFQQEVVPGNLPTP
jgi:hypothetical protein